MILFMVEMGNIHYLCYETNREGAKRAAFSWIGGNIDDYIVTPLTAPGDRIHIAVSVST